MNSNQQNDGPVFFVSGELKQGQNGAHYLWFKTTDLRKVMTALGTSIVSIVVTRPKHARSETERLMIIKPGDPKYVSKGDGPAKERPTQESFLI